MNMYAFVLSATDLSNEVSKVYIVLSGVCRGEVVLAI